MQPAKQEALETIGKLPDDADMNEIMYRLYVLDKIRKGQKAVKQGRTITSDDLKREIDSWWYGWNRLRPISDPSNDFIAHDSRHYAKKVTQDIVEKTDILNELPRIGRKVPKLRQEDIREISLYSYRILYEIKEQDVFVLSVIHKRSDLQPETIER